LFQLPSPLILTIFSDLSTGSRYRSALNTKLFPPHISSSVFFQVICTNSSQYSLFDPLDHLHWPLSSNHQFTVVSIPQTVLFSMLRLTYGINFLLLFLFLISLVHHHHAARVYRLDRILDRLLAFSWRYLIVSKTFLFPNYFHPW